MKTTQLLDFGSNILRSKKIISHRIDSEVILSYILKISREKLLIKEDKVCNENIIKFRSLISRRLKQEPVAYIIARKEFRSEDFFVDKKSLIPRPETELLIDPIVKIFKNKNLFFLDIGVGSGCIIFSILKELNHSKGIGIDICKKAVLKKCMVGKSFFISSIDAFINFILFSREFSNEIFPFIPSLVISAILFSESFVHLFEVLASISRDSDFINVESKSMII